MWPPWGWRIADCSHGGALFGVACSAVCLTRTTCYVSTTFLRPVEGKKKKKTVFKGNMKELVLILLWSRTDLMVLCCTAFLWQVRLLACHTASLHRFMGDPEVGDKQNKSHSFKTSSSAQTLTRRTCVQSLWCPSYCMSRFKAAPHNIWVFCS